MQPATLPDEAELMDDTDETLSEVEVGYIMVRPDGYHWQSADGKQEFGPFPTMEDALADMEQAGTDADDNAPGESLQEAEDEIGIADWIDPDTGEPAEGQSTPHLHDE
jgi:hypothetical protein